MNRRDYLEAIGAVGVGTSLAGCGDIDDEQEGSGGQEGNGGQEGEDEEVPDNAIILTVETSQEEPIENAEVELIEEGGFLQNDETIAEGQTDETGVFEITDVDKEEYLIVAFHEQYGRNKTNIEFEGLVEETLTLTPDLVLSVENNQGETVENAEVEVIEEGGFLQNDETVREGTTNESGTIVVADLNNESHVIKISHQDYLGTTEEFDFSGDNIEITSVLSSPEPANFQIINYKEEDFDVRHGEQIEFEATVENTGDQSGTGEVILKIGDEEIAEDIRISGKENETASFEVPASDFEGGTYQYEFHIDSEQVTGGELYILECPDNVPPYDTEGVDDISYEGIVRYDIDLRLRENGGNYSDQELIALGKEAVCVITEDEEVNGISVMLWEPDQIPGYEQAYGTVEWVPQGQWRRAGSVETGDYSEHEYSLTRF